MNEGSLVARWSVVVVTALLLQIGFAPNFPVFGVVPDLMLLVSVCAGVAGGPERGAIVGFFCGILFDLIRNGTLGISSLAYTVTAAVVGALMIQVLQMRRLLAMAVVATGSAAGALLYAVGAQLFGQNTLTNPRLWTIVAVVALVNGLLSPIVLRVARWAERRDELRPALGAVDG